MTQSSAGTLREGGLVPPRPASINRRVVRGWLSIGPRFPRPSGSLIVSPTTSFQLEACLAQQLVHQHFARQAGESLPNAIPVL
jgi:hypothetical protein